MIGWKNYDDTLSRFHTIPACHGQTGRRTDRRTELLYQYRASAAVCWRAIKIIEHENAKQSGLWSLWRQSGRLSIKIITSLLTAAETSCETVYVRGSQQSSYRIRRYGPSHLTSVHPIPRNRRLSFGRVSSEAGVMEVRYNYVLRGAEFRVVRAELRMFRALLVHRSINWSADWSSSARPAWASPLLEKDSV